ncbi:hypothetical protein PGTUg99_009044 [Puccinia graminis f. sp. tritici]|uniref:Uncharacterized protein n=1 Tax=Puccinia graminis f. sp. tritici TaxID=56615 RepID=A0A5B0RUD6_PUCGR|nr:hypothetical protein PGTUg99_009044 [Puccinia graminis f. sp. tritici]
MESCWSSVFTITSQIRLLMGNSGRLIGKFRLQPADLVKLSRRIARVTGGRSSGVGNSCGTASPSTQISKI